MRARFFGTDRSGSVVMLFALALLPLVLIVGTATDYALASRTRTNLQAATDTAVLAAVGLAVKHMKDVPNASTSDAIAAGKAYAQSLFAANMLPASGTLTLDVTFQNAKFTASGRSSAVQTNYFLSLASTSSVNVGTTSTARSSLPLYRDMTLLLDISQSMGLAVDEPAQIALWDKTKQATGEGCTFACHATLHSGKPTTKQVAKTNNIPLRIDALRSATKMLIDDARNSSAANFYRFSMYTADKSVKKLSDPSNNYTQLQTLADAIDLGPTTSAGLGASYLNDWLNTINTVIPSGGSGVTSAQSMQYLIFVTDGVIDTEGSGCTWGHCTAALDAARGTPIKNKNVNIAVIYTTFMPVYNDPSNKSSGFRNEYAVLVNPFASQIKPRLESCASSNLFFEAKDSAAIDAAFKAIFAHSASNALTQ